MARKMLLAADLQPKFWREEVGTKIYTLTRTQLKPNNEKTPYQLWKGRPTSVKYFKVFGSKCFIKINDESQGKFDSRVDKEYSLNILLGANPTSATIIDYGK